MNYKIALPPLFAFFLTSIGFAEQFRNPVRLATTADPDAVLVADLNGDGRPDILWGTDGVLIGGPATMQAFLAQPDGSFAAGPVLTLPTGVRAYCRVADETGDKIPDLICPYVSETSNSVMVFPGNGDGTFGNPIATALPQLASIIGAPADFNGDGVADFTVGSIEGTGYVLLGNGDGTFRVVAQTNKAVGYQFSGQYQALDVNGDGHLDLLFSNGNVLLGDGTGQFNWPAKGGGVWVLGSCTFGKLDGDAHIDEVCGQLVTVDGDTVGGTQLLIFHGNGDGTFNQTPIKTITYGDRTGGSSGYGTFRTPLAIVDLNGDGIPDIVAQSADGLTVLLGKPGLNFSYPAHYATGFDPTDYGYWGQLILQIADVNSDGLPDLVESGPNGVYVTYGRPDGVLDTAPAYELADTVGYLTVADFNGDGIPDVAVTGDEAIELSLGKGDGTFEYRTRLPQGNADFSSSNYSYILHGDFNGDHRQDIIAFGATPSNPNIGADLYILFGHGNGTFSTPAAVSLGSKPFPASPPPQVFDFNGDGKDDLVASDYENIYVALSKGDGSFNMIVTAASPTGSLETRPAIADVNGDGKLDAVFGGLMYVQIFSGRGDGTFATSARRLLIPEFNGLPVQGSMAVTVGDFDGDGHKDIALLASPSFSSQAPADQSVLFVYFGNGKGEFTAGVPIAAFDRQYSGLIAADVNKDGLDDLVLISGGGLETGSAIAVVHSQPGRTFGPEVDYYPGNDVTGYAVADLNRDGFPDLLFTNGDLNAVANSATVLMNLGNSAGVTGSVYALPEPSDAGKPFQLAASLDPPDQTALSGSVSFFVDGQAIGSAPLVDNQAIIQVQTALSPGLHTLKATWPGGGNFAAITLAGKHQVANGYPTSATLTCNYIGSIFLTPVTFTATVESTSGIPSGSVELLDGKSLLATIPLAGGIATYVTPKLTPGTHTIIAQYVPAAGWAASSVSLQQQVTPASVTVRMGVSTGKAYALQAIELKATVKAPAGGPMPTGTVQFYGNFSSPIGTSKLVNGIATLTTSIPTTGYTYLSAEYKGNEDYNSGYAEGPTLNVLINPTVVHVEATPNPAAAGESAKITASVVSGTVRNPLPTGSVEFFDNDGQIGSAQLVHGSGSITLSSLAVGKHPITVSYSGDPAFGKSQSVPYSLVIQKAPSTTTLSASPNPASAGTTVIFKAAVKGPRQPTGSVVFLDGATKLSGAIQVDFEGTATFSTSSLVAGTHSIVAQYSGDPNLTASSSKALSVTINP